MDAKQLEPKHFTMLRLAKLRGLKVRRIGEGVYAVTSHTRRGDGLEWVVTFPGMTCSCPARGYCSHLSAAVDYHFVNEASATDYTLYSCALSDDRLALRLRVRSGETTRNDRIYLRYCVKLYERKRRAAGMAITERRVHVGGGRYRTEQRCGPYVI